MPSSKPAAKLTPKGTAAELVTPRMVRIARWSLVGFVVAVLLLVFAVPRTPPPPPSLAHPDQAFVDRVGIVSPEFARQWAGGLLNDDRAQIVIYVDRKPPEGELAAWAIQTASDWKVGAAKDDTGLVVFVFTEPRLARIDVGYGLEDRLTDARVRQLLETHLVPAFARGEYERGFDALIFALRKEIGGDDADSIHARAAAARKRDDVPWFSQIGIAFARLPRVVGGLVAEFREGNFAARLPILFAGGIMLAIAAFGIAMLLNTAWRLVTLPGKDPLAQGQRYRCRRGSQRLRDRDRRRRLPHLPDLPDARAARGGEPLYPQGQLQRRRCRNRLAGAGALAAPPWGKRPRRG